MASFPVVAHITSDEFLRLYDRDEGGLREYELFDGEVTERPMPNRIHDGIKNRVCKELDKYLEQHPEYIALVETTFRLGPRMTFTPDVAVVNAERWNRMSELFATGAPDIAFEVISSESADRLKYKTDRYIESGSLAVCCIYPNQQRVMVFRPGRIVEFMGSDRLEFSDILPGFSMPLAAIFESLAS